MLMVAKLDFFKNIKKYCTLQETQKRQRIESEEEDASQEEEEAGPPAKKPALDNVLVEPAREEPPRPVGRPRKLEEHGVLRICLKHIHKMLQKYVLSLQYSVTTLKKYI